MALERIKMEIDPTDSDPINKYLPADHKIKQEPSNSFEWEREYSNDIVQIKQEFTDDFVQIKQEFTDDVVQIKQEMDDFALTKQEPKYDSVETKVESLHDIPNLLVLNENNNASMKYNPLSRGIPITTVNGYIRKSKKSTVSANRMSRRGNWNRALYRPHNRPHGLRGKDIGLYYKEMQIKKNKNKEKDFMFHLSVPPNILSNVQKNILSIKEIAKDCHIEISPPKPMNLVPIKCEKHEYFYDGNDLEDKPINVKDFVKFPKESSSSEEPSTSSNYNAENAMEVKDESENISLKGAGDYKYGYEDIITETFEEKLEKCLAEGTTISMKNHINKTLSDTFYEKYKIMIQSNGYKKMKPFREMLPAYRKSKELLNVINSNQVIVISGETGCGKSTQIPQIILDDAIVNKRGANIHILVTQPRRIAASSLAMRVADERAERLGLSVGYAVRLESVDPRERGSIKFCTTGILLSELETNQGLANYSHVILDEAHERDCHIDISMLMLKQVLQQRKDLKLILMSATIDAEKLTSYFDNCPMMHIEGLAYPVQDVYLEEILRLTNHTPHLKPNGDGKANIKKWQTRKNEKQAAEMQKDIQYKAEIAPWLESKKKDLRPEVYNALKDVRIEDLNINLIYELLLYICKGGPGAILVFLPGIAEITKLLRVMTDSNCFPKSRYDIYPLHSKLPSLEQHKIFQRPHESIRKIILATNIAETSITIDDIVYVIDCGKIKYSGLNIEDNISTLQTEWVSQANMRQRRGRAGRCQPGVCYHLVTSFRASKLEERLLPEIQRDSLLEPVLAIKRLRLGKAADALSKMPSPPAETTVNRAIKHLSQVGALDSEEKLTPLGWHLARLPVHPAAGKLLLLGTMFGCLNRAASVAAVWGFKDPFQLIIGKEQEVDEMKRNFALGEPSDHVAISEAIIQFEHCYSYQEKRNFAYENFLAFCTLELLCDMKKQFGNNLKQMGFLHNGRITSEWENRNDNNFSLFKAIVAASLYPNIATVKWKKEMNGRGSFAQPKFKARTPEDGVITIHPSSVMSFKYYPGRKQLVAGANWLVYWLKQRSSDLFLIDVTLVYTLPFLFFGELVVSESKDTTNYCIQISNVKVTCSRTTMDILWQLRSLLDQVLASKIGDSNKHGNQMSRFENQVLDAVMELITAEDERSEYVNDDSESDSDYGSRRPWRH